MVFRKIIKIIFCAGLDDEIIFLTKGNDKWLIREGSDDMLLVSQSLCACIFRSFVWREVYVQVIRALPRLHDTIFNLA